MADHTARFNNLFQIVSNVAIVVGLGLVIYELNQAKQIAQMQTMDEMFSRLTDRRLALVGEDPRKTLARAALRPADLTEEDVVALEEIYTEVIVNWANSIRATEISGIDRRVEVQIASESQKYFTTEPGPRWFNAWAATGRNAPVLSKAVEIAERVLQEETDNYYRRTYELLLAKY